MYNIYCIPYVFITILLFLLYLKERECQKKHISTQNVSILAIIILSFFLGLRGHLYTDFFSYYPFFQELVPLPIFDGLDGHFEPGFVIYSKIVKLLLPNYFGWIYVSTLIDLLAFRFVFKRYCKSTVLPFIFFIAFYGVMLEANLLRNMKAVDMFLFSIPYLFERKIGKYMLFNIIGATFHTSALLFIPVYFFIHLDLMRSIKWGLLLLVNVSYWLNIHFTSMLFGSFLSEDAGKSVEKLLGYASSEVSYGFSFGYFERTFTIVLFTCFYKELKKYGKSGAIFYNCSLLYYVLHILFSDVGVLAQRFSLLFVVGYWVNYSNIFCSNRVNKIVKYFILILLMMKVVVSYLTIDAKYQNVIFGVDSYDKRVYEVFYK